MEVRAKEDYAAELLAAVRRGELDAAITGFPDSTRPPSGVAVTDLASEPLVVAASRDHPLARETGIPLARLRDEPMVALTAGSSQRAHLERACRKAGFEPKITAETMRLNLLQELVSQGTGIAVIPRSGTGRDDGTVLIPITRPRLRVRIVLACGETPLSPAARAFASIVSALTQADRQAG